MSIPTEANNLFPPYYSHQTPPADFGIRFNLFSLIRYNTNADKSFPAPTRHST